MKSLQGKEFEEWIKANEGHYIDGSLIEEYNNRLQCKTKAKSEYDSFNEQIRHGNGQELTKKFWSKVSSSRMAFDLYSWIDNDNNCIEFQFEKKLPAIKSRGRKINANMDVYIRTSNNEIWFIESKFTETPQKINKLSEVYYVTRDKRGNLIKDGYDYKSPTWYYKSKKSDGLAAASVNDRFMGKEEVARQYIKFVTKMIKLSEEIGINKWFDAKQECCHLLGIIMFILDNPSAKNSNIHFRNIVYRKEENFIDNEEFAKTFMKEASEMVNNIISHSNLENISFDYDALTIQDVLNDYGKRKALGYDNKTVEQCIKDHFEGLFE